MSRKQTTTTQMVTADDVRPIIWSLFDRMTQQRWDQVLAGEPDDATVVIFTEMVVDLISLVTRSLLRSLTPPPSPSGSSGSSSTRVCHVSHEQVRTTVGDSLTKSFTSVLNLHDRVHQVSLHHLTDAIVSEVTANVNASLSTTTTTPDPVLTRISPAPVLNKMVGRVFRMFRVFTIKMKKLGQPLRCRGLRTRFRTRDLVLKDFEDEDDDEDSDDSDESDDSDDKELVPAGLDQARSTPDRRSITSEKSKTPDSGDSSRLVEDAIAQEMGPILDGLLEDVPDADYKKLSSESSSEIRLVAQDVIMALLDDVAMTAEAREGGVTCCGGAAAKIKRIFTNTFTRASFHRMLAQLKAKFSCRRGDDDGDAAAMTTLMETVDSMLTPPDDDDKQDGGNEVCLFRGLDRAPPQRVLVFTQRLSDLLYQHITRQTDVVAGDTGTPATRRIRADIQRRVINFLCVVNWWVNTQAAAVTGRVTATLMDQPAITQGSLTPSPVAVDDATPPSPVEVESVDLEKLQRVKVHTRILIEALVTRTVKKAKSIWVGQNPRDVIQRLYEQTWTRLDGDELDFTAATVEKLDKLVYKHLCETFGCSLQVMVEMDVMSPPLIDAIVSCVRRHLTRPRPGPVARFFSSIRNMLPCCRRHRRHSFLRQLQFVTPC